MKLNSKKMALIIFTMLGVAMFDNVRGVFVTIFMDTFYIDYKAIGLLMFLSSACYMTGSLTGGYLVDHVGKARLMRISAFAMCLGVLGTAYLPIFSLFMLSYMCVSFFTAIAAIIINTTIPELKVKNHALLMNFVHFLYGLGATIMIKLSGILVDLGWVYSKVYLLVFMMFVLLYITSIFVSLPDGHESTNKQKKYTKDQLKILTLFSIALGAYIVAEIQTGTWFISDMIKSYHLTENSASTYLSVFFAVFSLGRLFGGFIAHRIGYLKSVTISLAIACVTLFWGLTLGGRGLIVIALSGIFFSIAFPTIVLSIKEYFPNILAKATGTIIFFASLINVVTSYLFGILADSFGPHMIMTIIPYSVIVSIAMLLVIQVRYKPIFFIRAS